MQQGITQEQYDKKASELRSKITEQNEILNRFPEADKKRELLGLITLNLTIDYKKLYVELQKPFDAIYNCNKSATWAG